MAAGRWRRAIGVAVAGATVLAGLVLAGSAEAAPNQYAPSIGFATGSPLSGPVSTAPVVVTEKVCPAGTTAINGFVDSKDAGLVGAVAISSNTTQIDSSSTTGVNFTFNLLDVAASQGKVLVNGSYEVSLVCLPDLFGTPGTGQFDAVFTVTGGATPTSAGTTYTFKPGGNVKATTTTLAATPAGQGLLTAPVVLTATVSPVAAGTVQFTDVPRNGAPAPLGAPVTVDATGAATLDLSTLATAPPLGERVFRAAFTPADPAAFAPSAASDLPYVVLSDTQTGTVTTLAADPPTFVDKGRPVTLTATVTAPLAPATAPAPAGTVEFFDSNATLGTATLTPAGTAVLPITPVQAGTLNLLARFSPSDATAYAPSVSSPALTFLVTEPFSEGKFLDLLTIDQTRGKATDAITVKAPDACPSGSGVMTARISGPGAWAPGFGVPIEGLFDKRDSAVPLPPVASIAGPNGLTVVPGRYLIAVTCRVSTIDPTATGFFLARIWFYDAVNWLNADPAVVGIPTDVVLTAEPVNRAALGTTPVFTAAVTPADAPGSIVFTAVSASGDEQTLATVALTGTGTAVAGTTKLGLGLYYVTAAYDPGKVKSHNASASAELVYAVTRATPPLPKAPARITGTATVGRTVSCVAVFADSTARAVRWFRDGAAVSGATASTYRIPAADAGHRLQCRYSASNAGGTVYRDSPAVRVGR